MPNVYHAFDELKYASKHLTDVIKKVYTVGIGDSECWNNFLIHLNLCWIKAERGFQDVKNKFGPFQGKYKEIIKSDPLLIYLRQARNAVEHSGVRLIDQVTIKEDRSKPYTVELIDENNKIIERKVVYPFDSILIARPVVKL